MDKRFNPLTVAETLLARRALEEKLAQPMEMTLSVVIEPRS